LEVPCIPSVVACDEGLQEGETEVFDTGGEVMQIDR
jgi:hypothetical protein